MDEENEPESIPNENLDLESDEYDDDVAELSLEQVIEIMEEAWLNEKFAPEILPNKREIVEILLGQIGHMDQKVQHLDSLDFKRAFYQKEINRLKFLVTSYLRMRLEKIETFSKHILQQERLRVTNNENLYLSQNELEFAQEYEENLNQHFESVMSFCPTVMNEEALIVKPNMRSIVFLKAKKDIEGILVDESNDITDLSTGSRILICYNNVANLVKSGDVHLL
ncbi:unnamed protein product [Ceutorhynchus assimilis]|uniref:DNA replication complex GINS protein SLD5 n=1 Tax=Ceutorhynchus assimilis TaxID=467358 RepID=A0A9N9QPV1_9CUCU|nr:unnamed protein product [Ceutorhynchus assimilis]